MSLQRSCGLIASLVLGWLFLAALDVLALNTDSPRQVAEAGVAVPQVDPGLKAEVADGQKADREAASTATVDAEAASDSAPDATTEPTPVEPRMEDLVDSSEPILLAKDEEPGSQEAESDEQAPAPEPELYWHEDYREAYTEASEDRRMLLIFFHEGEDSAARLAFEAKTLAAPRIKAQLAARYVLAKLPCGCAIESEGKDVRLLDHGAFQEMRGRQGVAIIDLAHTKADYYGHVVSTFPFTQGKYYLPESFSIILDLPPGTLTQRTMIYAVRIHPEAPASTQGVFHNVLAEEAKSHSSHQAAILVQGHHNWDSRFHRINSKLPAGVLAQEVVAESWPNEDLVEACVDCVHSWRQSPGHWQAVRSRHPIFGFDIKLGRNGIWYATGIFGKR